MNQLEDLTKEELIAEIHNLQGTLTNLASTNANQSVTIANLQYQVQVLNNTNGDDE